MPQDKIILKKSDDVLCSAGRGQRPKVACLACALSHNNECGYDYALLNALFHDKERTGIHVTDLTGCLRKAYYEKMYPPLEHPHEMLARWVGTAVHAQVEATPSEHFASELSLDGLGLTGTADIVYHNGRIIDIKTTRWIRMDKLPYGSHVKQVNIYAALLRAQGKEVKSAAIQYIDLSGPSKCPSCKGPTKPGSDGVMVCQRCTRVLPNAHTGAVIVEVELEEPGVIAEWIATRKQILDMALEAEQTPDAEFGFLCDYCAFQEKCASE